MSKNILIAGLPDSGKSSYIAALWSCLEENFNHMKFGMDKFPDDCEYLYQLSSKWNDLLKFDRSSSDNINISLPLKDTETGLEHTLLIPDFKGETFHNLIRNHSNASLSEFLDNNVGLLYFIGNCNPGRFDDDIDLYPEEDQVETKEPPKVIFNISDVPEDARNMLVIKYLLEHYHFNNIVVCISAYDEKGVDVSVQEYIRKNSPGLFNFLESLSLPVKYMGVSAQGCNYEKLNIEDKKEYIEKTQKGERAYIVVDKEIIYDISLPIHAALGL